MSFFRKMKKLLDNMPSYPHYKMNIYSGTNSFAEMYRMLKKLIINRGLADGDDVKKYTNSIANYINNNNIYLFASGRMGFYSILKAIDLKQGEEVIIPAFTCVVVPNAIIYAGGKPVYCDINVSDYNIDISQIEKLITDKTRVLYAQHTFGQMCGVDEIKKLADKYNLIVVEDTALALGAENCGRYAGTIGDFGYFSTDRSKVINTGLGGFVSLNNLEYKKKFDEIYSNIPYLDKFFVRRIAFTFIINLLTLNPAVYWIGKSINFLLTKMGVTKYFLDEKLLVKPDKYSYPAKMSNILAEVGVSQMDNLKSNLSCRKDTAKYYNNILKIYSDEYINSMKNIFLRYSFLIKNRDYWEKRFAKKIDLFVWFKSIASGRDKHLDEIGYIDKSCENAEYCIEHVFNLPTHQRMKPKVLYNLLLELKESGDIITKERVL